MSATEPVSGELATMLSDCTVCRRWAEQDEGPYHRDAQPERRDVVEDRDGVVLPLGIRTIYPGWYPGRTVHIHLMVHSDGHQLTSQLYFPDETSDEIFARPPYAARPGRDTTNDGDEIFPAGGDPAVLDIVPAGDGYRAGICLELPDPGDAP